MPESSADASAPAATDAVPVRPARKRPRARYFVAAAVCLGVVVWMLLLLQKNVVYLRTVSKAVAAREDEGDKRFRMGGAVMPGTISETSDGVRFEITEGGAQAAVVLHGNPPDLFKDCAPVVVEGNWEGTTFDADRLLIKHGSDYRPPDGASSQCDEDSEDVFK